mmetsp:Transcript_17976/g.61266  ORF Transcript_17976/g.61266 Transcript_17976/m.61266 type:complete len:501 (+) Transcript_17976:176-1678(+)
MPTIRRYIVVVSFLETSGHLHNLKAYALLLKNYGQHVEVVCPASKQEHFVDFGRHVHLFTPCEASTRECEVALATAVASCTKMYFNCSKLKWSWFHMQHALAVQRALRPVLKGVLNRTNDIVVCDLLYGKLVHDLCPQAQRIIYVNILGHHAFATEVREIARILGYKNPGLLFQCHSFLFYMSAVAAISYEWMQHKQKYAALSSKFASQYFCSSAQHEQNRQDHLTKMHMPTFQGGGGDCLYWQHRLSNGLLRRCFGLQFVEYPVTQTISDSNTVVILCSALAILQHSETLPLKCMHAEVQCSSSKQPTVSTLATEFATFLRHNEASGVALLTFGNVVDFPVDVIKTICYEILSTGMACIVAHRQGLGIESDRLLQRPHVPQASLLAQPAVKAFVSHGGAMSFREAMACAVPTFIIPVFGDQFTNAQTLRECGAGDALRSVNNFTKQAFREQWQLFHRNIAYHKRHAKQAQDKLASVSCDKTYELISKLCAVTWGETTAQ